MLTAFLWASIVTCLFVRGFDFLVIVCITHHIHFILEISPVQFFRSHVYVHEKVFQLEARSKTRDGGTSNSPKQRSLGKKESVYFLLENNLLLHLFQYSHKLLGLSDVARRVMSNDKYLLNSLKPLPLERDPLPLLTYTGVPSEAKVLSIFVFTTLTPF